MIAHLQGREAALEPFGWTGRQAEWIALACLHSGVFTRTQATRFLDTHHEQGAPPRPRADRAGPRPPRRPCPAFGGSAACAGSSPGVSTARLAPSTSATAARRPPTCSCAACSRSTTCSSTPGLPWLPDRAEKVGAFEALGIERELLPSRLYRGAAGNTRRYFPLKLPVALDSRPSAVFVYVEPGHDTTTALRSWGEAHCGLWKGRSASAADPSRSWPLSAP